LQNWGYIKNGKFNFSDRFTAKMSGTTNKGNTLTNVWDSIRKDGLVPEDMWPYPREQRKPVFSWDNFYSEITQNIKDFGKHILEIFDFQYEWVNLGNCQPDVEQIKVQLKQAPLQLASLVCKGWDFAPVIAGCGCGSQHATMIYNIDDTIHDYDSYDRYTKSLAINYGIPWILKGVVTLKIAPIVKPNILPLTKDLYYGTRNNADVKNLQRGLIKWGYLSAGLDTGNFLNLTRLAVQKFQRDYRVGTLSILHINTGKYVLTATRKVFNNLLLKG
jgi:hypothetical protein